jgi:hypothetical protein
MFYPGPSKRPNDEVTLVTGRVVRLTLTRSAVVSCYGFSWMRWRWPLLF